MNIEEAKMEIERLRGINSALVNSHNTLNLLTGQQEDEIARLRALIPPVPRKVEVKVWSVFNSEGTYITTSPHRCFAENLAIEGEDRVVELTGSYEEPWPEAAKS